MNFVMLIITEGHVFYTFFFYIICNNRRNREIEEIENHKKTKMYYAKVHKIEKEVILAVCDKEVHARKFSEGNLRIFADPRFYGNKLFGETEIIKLFEEATILNLAGARCVEVAIKAKLVEPENVLSISSCKHAQVMK